MKNKDVGSKALNELMIRYAQDGQLSNVARCLSKGADVDFNNGQLALVAVYFNNHRILKLLLRAKATLGLVEARDLAEKLGHVKLVEMLNEYLG